MTMSPLWPVFAFLCPIAFNLLLLRMDKEPELGALLLRRRSLLGLGVAAAIFSLEVAFNPYRLKYRFVRSTIMLAFLFGYGAANIALPEARSILGSPQSFAELNRATRLNFWRGWGFVALAVFFSELGFLVALFD